MGVYAGVDSLYTNTHTHMLEFTAYVYNVYIHIYICIYIYTYIQEGRLTLVDLAGLDDTRKGATSQQPRTMDTSSVLSIAPYQSLNSS